jgi:hypothetical protein
MLTEMPFNGVPRNMLIVPTPGDTIVSVNAEIALPRAAGWIDDSVVDDRYGMTVDRYLIDRGVVSGLEEWGPYVDVNGASCLFDVDDLDEGLDGTGAPSDDPLRLTVTTSAGESAMRLPYTRTTGTHGFAIPRPNDPFDISTYMVMQIATYFQNNGQEVVDDLCLEDASCAWLPALPDEDTGGEE